jgi:outer membrane protein assembly factor BamE (lipoprotein component of BamABCDE complex)
MYAALQLQQGMNRDEVEAKLGTDQTKSPWRDDSGNESREYRVDFRGLIAVRSKLVLVTFDPDGRLVKWSK